MNEAELWMVEHEDIFPAIIREEGKFLAHTIRGDDMEFASGESITEAISNWKLSYEKQERVK